MKKIHLFSAFIVLALLFEGCVQSAPAEVVQTPADITKAPLPSTASQQQFSFTRDISKIDYSHIEFTPWDAETAAPELKPSAKKPYTIMIYMNGSDLESESGAATADLNEMLAAGVGSGLINVIIFAGGTYRWQNDVIPPAECSIWKLENVGGQERGIQKIAELGQISMGDPGTLSSFINFGIKHFPAERYGLILWDHGGGSIAGYGWDEIFDDSISLMKLDYALMRSDLKGQKFEFIGFDACLMATVETAIAVSNYASYLVASEDLEPGEGWNYSFLQVLNAQPDIDGAALGTIIADYYVDFYGGQSEESLTLSVTDLSSVGGVMGAMGALMDKCGAMLSEYNRSEKAFAALSKRRDRTKTFGNGSARDNDCDMVDIGDMAYMLSDLFPSESAAVISALSDSVIYNRNNSDIWLGGLSTFYIFGGYYDSENTLKTYSSLNMSAEYTSYLHSFADIMNSEATLSLSGNRNSSNNDAGMVDMENLLSLELAVWLPVPDSVGYYMAGKRSVLDQDLDLWPSIYGVPLCLELIQRRGGISKYAAAAQVNGFDADIIVSVSKQYPDGKILGFRREDGYIMQKGIELLKEGDRISFYYPAKYATAQWYQSPEITLNSMPELSWRKMPEGSLSLLLTDIRKNEYITGFFGNCS